MVKDQSREHQWPHERFMVLEDIGAQNEKFNVQVRTHFSWCYHVFLLWTFRSNCAALSYRVWLCAVVVCQTGSSDLGTNWILNRCAFGCMYQAVCFLPHSCFSVQLVRVQDVGKTECWKIQSKTQSRRPWISLTKWTRKRRNARTATQRPCCLSWDSLEVSRQTGDIISHLLQKKKTWFYYSRSVVTLFSKQIVYYEGN